MHSTNRRPQPVSRVAARVLAVAFVSISALIGRAGEIDPAEQPVQLESFAVTAQRTESKNYKVEHSLTATKTDTPLLDVPQSVTIVTEQQIKDQQMLSLGDVVRYVPGVTAIQGENNRDQIVFRGNSSSADFYLNGVRDDVQYYRDLYNLTRVEILRGPNAMLFGRGGGGGLINRVTKEAGFTPVRELTLQGGSFGNVRAALDFDQPITPQVASRVNAMSERSDSFRHGVKLERAALNPTLTFAPSPQTKVAVGYEYLFDNRTADRGLTSFQGRPATMPIATFFGNPADSHVRADVNLLSALIEHQAGRLGLRNHTLFGDYDRSYQNYVPGAVNAAQTQVALTAYNNATRRKNLFNQTDVTYQASTGAVSHTLLAGIELGNQLTDNFRNTGYFSNTATAITVPYASTVITTPVTFRQSATDADNHLQTALAAAYAQDQIVFSKYLQAIVGLRFDSFDLSYHNNRTGETLGRRDGLVSPRAGLIIKPAAQLSLYGNYSVSYLPSSGDQFSSLTTLTQQMKPEKFTNHELGAKWELNPTLNLTAAIYQLDRTNTRATDPADPTRIIQTGSTRTSGFEFGAIGSLTPAWSVAGGYAYQDASIRRATTSASAGAQVAQVPHHNFSLWNKYELTRQLTLGLGVIYRSDMFAAVDNTVTLPGYTRVDAAVFYTLNPRWHLQANVENLLNRKYYVNADSNTNISPGAPFTLRLMLRQRF
jgi:catecholate siderophore receptor